MTASMFERYGGFGKVSRIVLGFYERVGDSDILAPFFAGTDMRRLVDHQTKFVASLMGGPASYTDDTLRRAHARLGVTQAAFDEMTMLLRETFEEFALAPADIQTVMTEIHRCRDLIVTR